MTRLFAGTPFDRPPRCERCGALEADCECLAEKAALLPPEKQTAQVVIERRKNKRLVTRVLGLAGDQNDLPGLLTRLKNACASGGTCTDEGLELQGDHHERVRQILKEIGYKLR